MNRADRGQVLLLVHDMDHGQCAHGHAGRLEPQGRELPRRPKSAASSARFSSARPERPPAYRPAVNSLAREAQGTRSLVPPAEAPRALRFKVRSPAIRDTERRDTAVSDAAFSFSSSTEGKSPLSTPLGVAPQCILAPRSLRYLVLAELG